MSDTFLSPVLAALKKVEDTVLSHRPAKESPPIEFRQIPPEKLAKNNEDAGKQK